MQGERVRGREKDGQVKKRETPGSSPLTMRKGEEEDLWDDDDDEADHNPRDEEAAPDLEGKDVLARDSRGLVAAAVVEAATSAVICRKVAREEGGPHVAAVRVVRPLVEGEFVAGDALAASEEAHGRVLCSSCLEVAGGGSAQRG